MYSLHRLALKLAASAALLSLLPLTAGAAEQPQSACQPGLHQTRTAFPQRSQQQGEHGVVQVQVRFGTDGRATAVAVAQSSGYPALDRAATDSVRKYWLFDVTHCTPEELQKSYDVTVQFERATRYTLSNTVDRRVVAQTKELTSSNRCQVVDDESGTQVFACIPETVTREERNAKLVENTTTR